jgi:HlyD family secretion protein
MSHRMKRIRWPALAVAGVLVAGSGTAYAVTNDGSSAHYRTVRAAKGDVEQLLSTSGTVDAAHRADLGFATGGTVASVKVALGDTVKAGQVIATLDTETLRAAVTRAKASVAKAVAQLESDRAAQAAAVDAASATTPAASSNKPKSSTPSATPTSGAGSDDTATLATLKAQQDAVIAAQSAATATITAAKEALAAQADACADAYQSAGGSGDASTTDGDAEQAAADTACADALADVQAKQDDVSDAQDTLADALSALAETLTKALAALSSSSTPSGGSDNPSSAGTDTPSGSATTPASDGSDGASAGQTVTAAQLAGDQAQIEQARAELVAARQQLGQAVLRSTRAGKVVSLDVHRGDDVSAGDTVAVVVGGKAVTIETTVAESKIAQVKVGQRVRVTMPGESRSADGIVTAIGLVADSSSGTASYPVTVTIEDPTIALPAGSQAMLAIVVATAQDVVTVPTSAITRRDGDRANVQTWDGTKLSSEAVTIGTVGAREVEVTDGLAAGDQVVLADLDKAISGASDTINDRGGFGNAPAFRVDRAGPGGGPVTFKSGG